MNDVQHILMQLREKGWTLAAISRELNIPASTLRKWSAGLRYPAYSSTVKAALLALSPRKAVRKTYHERLKQLSPEVRAGIGLFKHLSPERSAVDELIQERRREAALE